MLFRQASLLLVVLAAASGADASGGSSMPPNHPPPITGSSTPPALPGHMRQFAATLRCPYASEWLTKGPERASRDLAERHGRRAEATTTTTTTTTVTSARQEQRSRSQEQGGRSVGTVDYDDQPIKGSCSYTNTWTSTDACVEFRGWGWTLETMEARCGDPATGGVLSAGAACELPPSGASGNMAGWCMKLGGQQPDGGDGSGSPEMMIEASPMMKDGMGCDDIGNACTTFAGGDVFQAAGGCLSGGDESVTGAPPVGGGEGEGGGGFDWTGSAGGGADASSGPITCQIAPGPIGAAHQAAYSSGYRSDCPDTPAESSPYQWPLRWTAENEMQSMLFGSDNITYTALGKVWYMLDKNWKRSDVYRQYGTVPFFARSSTEDDFLDLNVRTTMLHKGSKMYFITYHNGTLGDDVSDIKECSWLDLSVVGNIRPDWFMDDRGDSTDVQYLGNQHVYYDKAGPRLVKQWRKKDFASQYFTMSVQENVVEGDGGVAGTHWPLTLNVPGEGFGDDMLQSYKNHELLTDDDTDIFLLDEAFVKAGGSCPQGMRVGEDGEGGGGGGGPPADMEKVPSNLEIDENSWFSNVYTFSPVWVAPKEEVEKESLPAGELAVTKAGPSTSVSSCYDSPSGAVELSITFDDLSVSTDGSIPWLGLSFRESDDCLMTPPGGGDADVALVMSDDFGALTPLHYVMSPSTKSFSSAGAGSSVGRGASTGFTPLEDTKDFSDVRVTHSDAKDSVTLHFKRATSASSAPDVMHLTYAIGAMPQFGYHSTRTCFDVNNFPPCPSGESMDGSETASSVGMAEDVAPSGAAKYGLAAGAFVSVLVSLIATAATSM